MDLPGHSLEFVATKCVLPIPARCRNHLNLLLVLLLGLNSTYFDYGETVWRVATKHESGVEILAVLLTFQEELCLMDVGDREESFSSSTRQERDKHLVPAHRDLHRTCRGW